MVVGVALVGTDERPFGQLQLQLLEEADVSFRSCRQGELHRLPARGTHQMHAQTVEIAAFARYV
jgi:hypothetical protein